MRQVLATLIKLLVNDTRVSGGTSLDNTMLRDSITRCMAHVYGHEDLSCVKPSMIVLDTLLSKKLISPTSLIDPRLNEVSLATKINSLDTKEQCENSSRKSIDHFINNVLRWARHLDIMPSASRLLVSFVRATLSTTDFPMPTGPTNSAISVWISPVRKMIHRHPDMLEFLEQHILPDLLRIDAAATSKLIQEMPMEHLLRRHTSKVSEKDIRFCLLISRVMDELCLTIDLGR